MANYVPRPTPPPTGRNVKANFTVREMFEMLAYELNKVSAPSIDVDTFNHFHRVGRDNFYKLKYQLYDENQLLTDQLREMSATFLFTATSTPQLNVGAESFPLPTFYYHMLSVTVFWKILADFRIYKQDQVVNKPAERVSADRLAMIRDDHYNRPQLKKPYFLIQNNTVLIHAGIHSQAQIQQVEATYLMQPEEALLLETDLDDLTVDPSQVLRERGVISLEVLKVITNLVLENQGNAPRLQTHIPVSQVEPNTVAAPAQAQPAPQGR